MLHYHHYSIFAEKRSKLTISFFTELEDNNHPSFDSILLFYFIYTILFSELGLQIHHCYQNSLAQEDELFQQAGHSIHLKAGLDY